MKNWKWSHSVVSDSVTLWTVAYQAPPCVGFSRQEYWSGLPFPSPMHESEKWKGSCSVVSDSLRPHGLQPTRLLCPWDFPGKSTRVGCHCLLQSQCLEYAKWLDDSDNHQDCDYCLQFLQDNATEQYNKKQHGLGAGETREGPIREKAIPLLYDSGQVI